MPIKNVLASVAVSDLNASIGWYEKVLGKPASQPMADVAEFTFERGGALQLYRLPERAGAGSFTLSVTNVDEEAAQLSKLNIDTSHRTTSDRVKTIMITDPDGNHIAFAEAIDAGLAH